MGFKKKYWLTKSDTRPSVDSIDITDLVERLQEVDEELWNKEWDRLTIKEDEFEEPVPWDNDKPHRIFGSYIDFLDKEMEKKDRRYYERNKKK